MNEEDIRRFLLLSDNRPDELLAVMQRRQAAAGQALDWMQRVLETGGQMSEAENRAAEDALERAAKADEELLAFIRSASPRG